jgi:hypothetical protein
MLILQSYDIADAARSGQNLGRLSFWTFTFFIGTMSLAILLGMVMCQPPPPPSPPPHLYNFLVLLVVLIMRTRAVLHTHHVTLMQIRVYAIRPGEGRDLGSGACGGANKEVEVISQPGKTVDAVDRSAFGCWMLSLCVCDAL